jgi:hypothetical protein
MARLVALVAALAGVWRGSSLGGSATACLPSAFIPVAFTCCLLWNGCVAHLRRVAGYPYYSSLLPRTDYPGRFLPGSGFHHRLFACPPFLLRVCTAPTLLPLRRFPLPFPVRAGLPAPRALFTPLLRSVSAVCVRVAVLRCGVRTACLGVAACVPATRTEHLAFLSATFFAGSYLLALVTVRCVVNTSRTMLLACAFTHTPHAHAHTRHARSAVRCGLCLGW